MADNTKKCLPDNPDKNSFSESAATSSRNSTNKTRVPSSHRSAYSKKLTRPASADFNYLANLYWKFPTVHQEIYAFPLHTNRTLIAAARSKSERLRRELEKEPERYRVSKENTPPPVSKKVANKNNANIRKTQNVGGRQQQVMTTGRRRTVNQSLVEKNNKAKSFNLNNVRRSHALNHKKANPNDPSVALDEFRKTRGFVGSEGEEGHSHSHHENRSSKSSKSAVAIEIDEQTPAILDAIREQNEDVEYNKPSAKIVRMNRKCCDFMRQPFTSYRFTCIAFSTGIIIVIILCIVAIVYPIAKVLVMYE